MAELDIDLAGQRSKGVDEYLGKKHFHYLVTVCRHAEENCPRIFPGINTHLHWDLEDPVVFAGSDEEKLKKFREIRDQIDRQIQQWLAELETTTNLN